MQLISFFSFFNLCQYRIFYNKKDIIKKAGDKMKVYELMQKNVFTVNPTDSIKKTIEKMKL